MGFDCLRRYGDELVGRCMRKQCVTEFDCELANLKDSYCFLLPGSAFGVCCRKTLELSVRTIENFGTKSRTQFSRNKYPGQGKFKFY